MRIVLDSSILVRAFGDKRGLASELLIRIVEDSHILLVSNEILQEVAKVLRYPQMMRLHGLPEERVYDFIGYLRERAEMVMLNPLLNPATRDLNDVAVMQTAIFGDAAILCSKDKDFFSPPAFDYLAHLGIAVLDDIALMQRLRS